MSEVTSFVRSTLLRVQTRSKTRGLYKIAAFEKLPSGALTNQTRADHDAAFGRDWPDVEILTLDGYTGRLNDFLTGAPDLGNYASIIIGTIAPFSRGNVSISSGDTNVYPNVNPNWISDPRDREIAVAAFKRARAIFQNGAVQPLLVGPEAYPGDTVETDERILQYITSSSSTIHHAAGTNRKGKSDDPMAVVDSRGMWESADTAFRTLQLTCSVRQA